MPPPSLIVLEVEERTSTLASPLPPRTPPLCVSPPSSVWLGGMIVILPTQVKLF